MAKNKKPAKKYRPRDVVRPMNARNPWLTEGDVHAALLSMEAGQCTEDHLAMLCAHGDIMRRLHPAGPVNVQANAIIRMVGLIMARPDRRITPAEELPIRAAVVVTLPALREARNADILRVAQESMKDMDRFKGVRL